MYYEDRIVCYLDVLAFKKCVNSSLSSVEDFPDKIEDIAQLIASIRGILNVDAPEERVATEVTQFSDSVVISFKVEEKGGVYYALSDIMCVQLNMPRRGYLCRGGIAQGKVVHNNKLLFGPAMISAYELELHSAIYPRVILHESIIRLGCDAHAGHHLSHHEEGAIYSLVKLDFDGFYYVDYISSAQGELDEPELDYPGYLSKMREIIAEGLREKDSSVIMKYEWMRHKFQSHLDDIKKSVQSESSIYGHVREAYESIQDL